MLGGPYKRVEGAVRRDDTRGASPDRRNGRRSTQPRQEYAAAGQGECKDMGEDRPGMSFLMVPGLPSHTVRRND